MIQKNVVNASTTFPGAVDLSTRAVEREKPSRSIAPGAASSCKVFTVDVEDYFQVTAFEQNIDRSQWDTIDLRVHGNVSRILELLERHQTKGTFFVVGWLAEKIPEMVAEIDRAGHEIGSHSHWHRLIHQLSPAEFREDVQRSKKVIEDIIQKPVTTYRAPTFSIIEETFWAIDVLLEEGFTVDSSIFPSPHTRNGMAGFQPEIQRLKTAAGTITEFPMPVVQCLGRTIPAGGGGYFRIYPYWLTRHFVRQLNRMGRPFMFYVHPWELDTRQPRNQGLSYSNRFRHYVNLHTTFGKLDRLLHDFQFVTLSESLRLWEAQSQLQKNCVTAT